DLDQAHAHELVGHVGDLLQTDNLPVDPAAVASGLAAEDHEQRLAGLAGQVAAGLEAGQPAELAGARLPLRPGHPVPHGDAQAQQAAEQPPSHHVPPLRDNQRSAAAFLMTLRPRTRNRSTKRHSTCTRLPTGVVRMASSSSLVPPKCRTYLRAFSSPSALTSIQSLPLAVSTPTALPERSPASSLPFLRSPSLPFSSPSLPPAACRPSTRTTRRPSATPRSSRTRLPPVRVLMVLPISLSGPPPLFGAPPRQCGTYLRAFSSPSA